MKKTIIDMHGKLYPAQSATNVAFPFTLDAPMDSLTIEYAYWPKVLSDDDLAKRMLGEGMEHCVEEQDRAQFPIHEFLPLVNLVTLSVDAPDGYRGCAQQKRDMCKHVSFFFRRCGYLPPDTFLISSSFRSARCVPSSIWI